MTIAALPFPLPFRYNATIMAAILELLAFIALVVTIIAGLLQIADRLDKWNRRRNKP